MNRLPVWANESRDDVASFNLIFSWSDSDRAFQGTISPQMNHAVFLKHSHVYVESEVANAPQMLETVRWMRLHWWERLCALEHQNFGFVALEADNWYWAQGIKKQDRTRWFGWCSDSRIARSTELHQKDLATSWNLFPRMVLMARLCEAHTPTIGFWEILSTLATNAKHRLRSGNSRSCTATELGGPG